MVYVHENSFVYSNSKGLIKIKDVNIRDEILCDVSGKDVYTKVNNKHYLSLNNYNKIEFQNGSILNCVYENKIPKFFIAPKIKNLLYDYDESKSNIAWFLGMHTGDGTSDRHIVENKRSQYYQYRIRILGDEENCIREYSKFINEYLNCMNNYKISKSNKTWEYCVSNKNVIKIIDELFDGHFGNKTFSGDVYSYIENNNLWIPYISGLIDSDGYIKIPGHVRLDMCMTKVIDKILCILSVNGIRYRHSYITKVDAGESPIHSFYIYSNENICSEICKYLKHDRKRNQLINRTLTYKSKNKYSLDQEFVDSIIIGNGYKKYTKQNIYDAKHDLVLGLGQLHNLLECSVISEEQYERIIRQNSIIKNVEISEPSNFISLETTSGNYYTGNFGLINVKCS